MEEQVPVRELNQRTSSILAKVEKGTAITITRDGRPVARLVPIAGASRSLDRLVETGLVTAPAVREPIPTPATYGEERPEDVAHKLVADRESERA